MTRERVGEIVLERGGLVAFVTLVLYMWLAPHHVVDGDNAELATLSVTGGAAHPSGYPLYVLWLRATSWLPGDSPAHTAALATALLGAGTVLVLHAACRAWGASALAATATVVLFATGPVVLRVTSEAEVFALNNLVVATVLWLAAARGPVRGYRRAALLGLVAGLGLSDHLTCVLVAPVGMLGVVRAARESRAPVAFALASVGFAVGLTPYAYLLAAPDTPMSWGKVDDLDGVLAMFLREDYGGPTAFRANVQEVSAWTNLVTLVMTLGRAWWWLPFVVGLGVLGLRASVPNTQSESRAAWILLGVSWLLAGPLLVVRFNVPPEHLGLYVNQRFHLLPALLLALPIAQAFDLAFVRVRGRRPLLTTLLATVAVAALAATSLPYVGRVHSPAVELGAKNLLHSLPADAVVVHSQDELHAVTGYVQTALGQRRDVTIVTWGLMALDWYRERVAARGVVSGPGSGTPQVRLVGYLLARGRPVFADRLQRDIIDAFPTHPYGVLIRVLPPGTKLPSVREVFDINEQVFAGFALDYPRPGPTDEFATEVHLRYSATWDMIGRMLEKTGDRETAARAFDHAHRLAPSN